jgi:hemerythrin superfamily protein
MFKDAEKLDAQDDQDELQQIVETACRELKLHAEIEEELVYPAIMEAMNEDDQDLMREAIIEHASAKDLIAQLEQMNPGDENYQPTFKVLGEYVNHHIKEEEGEMFPKAKKAKIDVDGLGEAVMERKRAAGEGDEETER